MASRGRITTTLFPLEIVEILVAPHAEPCARALTRLLLFFPPAYWRVIKLTTGVGPAPIYVCITHTLERRRRFQQRDIREKREQNFASGAAAAASTTTVTHRCHNYKHYAAAILLVPLCCTFIPAAPWRQTLRYIKRRTEKCRIYIHVMNAHMQTN